MVVVSRPAFITHPSIFKTCKSTAPRFSAIPVIDLSDPQAKTLLVKACEDFGFFKVINHGVSKEIIRVVESEAFKFFNLPQTDKDCAGPPNPFGYGNKKIGPNGDVGWVEYLLFTTNPQLNSSNSLKIMQNFRNGVDKYISDVKRMICEVAEKIAEGLRIKERNALSKLLRDSQSDSAFRMNHYPTCHVKNLIGFGEHTDPQILSVLKSNDTSGFQIALHDGTWVSVTPDPTSFFILVGDSLQVMTNGRFKSVRHRVLADSKKSRISMIYFAGPPLKERISPLGLVMEEGEESLYKEFTWEEYKNAAYKSRLADYRLGPFEKKQCSPSS